MKNSVFDFTKKKRKKKTKGISNHSGRVIALDRPRALIENRAKKERKKEKTIIDGFHGESCQSD